MFIQVYATDCAVFTKHFASPVSCHPVFGYVKCDEIALKQTEANGQHACDLVPVPTQSGFLLLPAPPRHLEDRGLQTG